MMIWRGLSPKAILDCLDYLLSSRRANVSDVQQNAQDSAREAESKRRIDQATIKIESRP